ncbi:MAG: alpha/beta hydrolase [Christensenellales bacterium]|jgi:putative tributyrin esterase
MANIKCNFLSYTLRRAVDLTVIVPTICFSEMMEKNAAHKQGARYPVLYLLHGYGNNHATWNGYTSVELFAEERNIAVVMLSAENKAYINHGGDDNYFDFISRELPEFIFSMFPVSNKPEDTYIAGLSMGGYGALVHGLAQSNRFAAIGAFSGATGRGRNTAAQFDVWKLAEACAEEGRKKPMYIACGDKDFLYKDNVAFKDRLIELGFDVTWIEGADYTHEWRFWNREVEAFLDWIPRTDESYNGGAKRKI